MFRDQPNFYIHSLDEYKEFMRNVKQVLSDRLMDTEVKKILAHIDTFLDDLIRELKSDSNFNGSLDEAGKSIIKELAARLNNHTIELLANHSRQDIKNYEYNKFKEFILHHACQLQEVGEFVTNYDANAVDDMIIREMLNQINSILGECKSDNKKLIVKSVQHNIAQVSNPNKPYDPAAILSSLQTNIEFMKESENQYYSGITFFAQSRKSNSSLTKVISQMEDCYHSLCQRFPSETSANDIMSSFHVI